MKKYRTVFLTALMIGLGALIAIYFDKRVQPPFSATMSTLFQEIGKPVKSVDRIISQVVPIGAIDEKMLGDEIKADLAENSISNDPVTVGYLNSLIESFKKEPKRPFDYRVFLIEGPPNACAMPGGAICVTTGLLDLLENEAELVSVLGHEMGHIERGHLFDAAREEMLKRKIQNIAPSLFAAKVLKHLVNLTFSKTQEDEADEYGFRLLVKMGYAPSAMSTAFEKLNSIHSKEAVEINPLNDFVRSHPHGELRMEKFRSRADLWKAHHPTDLGYLGRKNYTARTTRFQLNYPEEWVR